MSNFLNVFRQPGPAVNLDVMTMTFFLKVDDGWCRSRQNSDEVSVIKARNSHKHTMKGAVWPKTQKQAGAFQLQFRFGGYRSYHFLPSTGRFSLSKGSMPTYRVPIIEQSPLKKGHEAVRSMDVKINLGN